MNPPTIINSPVPVAGQLTDLADLKRKSVRGGAITFVSQGISIVIQLASTVILARLLSPADYGTMAMVVAITAFAGLFRDLGLSTATIQREKLTHGQASTMFWMNVAVGAALTLIIAIASPLVAWFYQKPELTLVTLVLSVSFLLGSIGSQPNAHLTRKMRFGRIACANIVGALIGLVISIILALNGCRYWALVGGSLATSFCGSILLFILSGFRPALPRRGTGVRVMLKFGANVTAFNFVNYFARNLDNILIGRVWGAGPLGLYSRAYSLLMFPITNLRGPINAVAFPAMCQLQSDPARYRAYYKKITALLAFVSMPLAAFLCVCSENLIRLVLGDRWAGVSDIFRALALTAFIQPVAGFRGIVLLSSGMGGKYFRWGLWNAVFAVITFGIGVFWGPVEVAVAYGIGNYLLLHPSLIYVFNRTPVKVMDFYDAIARAAITSLMAGFVVFFIKDFSISAHTVFLTLLCQAVVFFSVYMTIFCLLPGGLNELRDYMSFKSFIFTPKSGGNLAAFKNG